MALLSTHDLADVMVLEYAGALPEGQVRSAVSAADRSLPPMKGFAQTRAGLLKGATRRLLVDRVVHASSIASATARAASGRAASQRPSSIAS